MIKFKKKTLTLTPMKKDTILLSMTPVTLIVQKKTNYQTMKCRI